MSADQFIDGKPQGAYAFIQWKGTDVCADIYCTCGEHGHIDAAFMYAVKCPKCGTSWEVGCFMALRLLADEKYERMHPSAILTWESEVDE